MDRESGTLFLFRLRVLPDMAVRLCIRVTSSCPHRLLSGLDEFRLKFLACSNVVYALIFSSKGSVAKWARFPLCEQLTSRRSPENKKELCAAHILGSHSNVSRRRHPPPRGSVALRFISVLGPS